VSREWKETMNTNSPVKDSPAETAAETTPVVTRSPGASRRWPWQRNPFGSAGAAGVPAAAPGDGDLGQTRRAVQVEVMLDQVKPVRCRPRTAAVEPGDGGRGAEGVAEPFFGTVAGTGADLAPMVAASVPALAGSRP
jgi:hypothetical protein